MKVVYTVLAIALVGSLSSCGVEPGTYEQDCQAAGGEVVVVGTKGNCVVNGAVVADWYAG